MWKAKKDKLSKKTEELNNILKSHILSKSLDNNVIALKKLFEDDDTIVTRSIVNNNDSSMTFFIAYSNGLVDPIIINENIIKPLMLSTVSFKDQNIINLITEQVILIDEIKKVKTMKEIIENVNYGDTVLFVDNVDIALVLNTKGFKTRAIEEPTSEHTLAGPREGFNESLITNVSMLKRKLRTNELKVKYISFGKESNTKTCVCYIDNIVDKKVLEQLYERISKIDIDGILDSNYITELIRDSPNSLFKTIARTEKPDVVAAKLLEGRIALIVDGSPSVITVPFLFIENFQSSEDYYLNYLYSSLSRILRILGFFISISIPAIYISIVSFHPQMLPTKVLINIALARESVPLPASIEAFILIFFFDILKEAGIRMPSNIGEALSTVGALVIGQAAVQAKLVAAPMIIVVAAVGITSLLIPKMNTSTKYLRIFLLVLASTLGFFGILIGVSIIMIHLLRLKSFGAYLIPIYPKASFSHMKDTVIRVPRMKMIKRPDTITKNIIRMKTGDEQQ